MPVLLLGFSTGPPPKRTGAAVDGGFNCTACHRTYAPANADSRGSVFIDAANYIPGVKQTIKVTVMHPEAARWGFELTARLVSDETKTAGEFAPNDVVRVICDDGSFRGSLAPCQPGQLTFAEHLNAPRTSPGAGFTFTVDWTPPATDAGDIVFYAAGNAANGDGAFNGDRIYTTVRRVSAPCNLTRTPSITRMVNGASFAAPWSVGALVTIFGSNFAPTGSTRQVTAGDIVSAKFPQSLGCVAVTVNGQNAPLLYAQGDQINLQVPALAGVGPATVVVIANPGASNELRSDPLTLNTQQAYSPAFFTPDGRHIAAIYPNGASSAKPGDVVALFGTGMGQTDPAFSPGDIALDQAQITGPLSVSVGGVSIPLEDILYVGVAPDSICGLQQVNVRLPSSLPNGDVAVVITVGGAQSQSGAMIAVSR
jgi:uncharacterized protein (TIGR03437 family)